MRRRRRPSRLPFARRRLPLLLAVLLLGAGGLAALDNAGAVRWPASLRGPADHSPDLETFDAKTVRVERVIDGDTVEIRLGDRMEKVRMIGIDSPEMNHGKSDPPERGAVEAGEWLRQRALHKTITLRLQPGNTRDRYQRMLAYLYDGDANINLESVRLGYSRAETRYKHPMLKEFEQAEAQARRDRRGIWK